MNPSAPTGQKPITIEVFSDLVCPWCRIGKKHLDDALAIWAGKQETSSIELIGSGMACGPDDAGACDVNEGGASLELGTAGSGSTPGASATVPAVEVRYRAFQLDPSTPLEGRPFRESLAEKFGGMHVVDQMTGRVTEAGAQSGVTFRFDRVTRSPHTILGHRLFAIAPDDKKEALMDALFRAYFEEGREIGELDSLLAIAESVGLDSEQLRAQLAAGDGAAEVQADLDRARRIGVTGVPFFVFGGKYAISGAYPPAELVRVIERVAAEQAEG